eukprot:gnl/TRDRNA2_/TRDRNA2_57155_c0_seq2.p1 gnl/TRDRNA2_/TRDRNA2_57155_c0~~gnl/TRDRNA2_/TRDRNA2_57155_c0_seq2.p1  ORF type:complete len:614 (+),score=114.25 gnl/TRDRNA2_/TRDRNA2_57155_c0_seq2:215-2056(+)
MSTNDDFLASLSKRFGEERLAFVKRLEDHLEEHHNALLAEIQLRLPAGSPPALAPAEQATAPEEQQEPQPPSCPPEGDQNDQPVAEPPERNVAATAVEMKQPQKQEKQGGGNPALRLSRSMTAFMTGEEGLSPIELAKRYHQQQALHSESKQIKQMEGHVDPVNCFEHLVEKPNFEFASVGLIVVNTIIMVIEVQYASFDLGYELGVQDYDSRAKDVWPGAGQFFEISNVAFSLAFAIEFFIRILAKRLKALQSAWLWFDAVIVTFSLLEVAGLSNLGLNPSMMRIARLARIVRLLKLVKTLESLDVLYLLVRSVQASLPALVWSFVLLFVVQVAVGLLIGQLVRPFLTDEEGDPDIQRQVFLYFGPFSGTMLTMYEITLANWVPTCRLLSQNISELFAVLYVMYRCIFAFALIKVITAVFISETNRAAAADDDLAVRKKKRDKRVYLAKLQKVFEEMDKSGDGLVTWKEFEATLSDDSLKTWLATLEIDVVDMINLFQVLENGNGQINIDGFMRGIQKTKGYAQGLDVITLSQEIQKVGSKIDNLLAEGQVIMSNEQLIKRNEQLITTNEQLIMTNGGDCYDGKATGPAAKSLNGNEIESASPRSLRSMAQI